MWKSAGGSASLQSVWRMLLLEAIALRPGRLDGGEARGLPALQGRNRPMSHTSPPPKPPAAPPPKPPPAPPPMPAPAAPAPGEAEDQSVAGEEDPGAALDGPPAPPQPAAHAAAGPCTTHARSPTAPS